MPSKILSANDPAHIQEAAGVLQRGGIVAFPTETVYGLGADALNPKAVARVFEVKKRPVFDPLIVHVASSEEAFSLWREVPKAAATLIKEFWPGPLTLVLSKTEKVPDIVTAGLPSVAVRMPGHPITLELIRSLGRPIAAPSANFFGYTSSTTAQAVAEDFGEGIDLILDGGPSSFGIESTVLKIEGECCVLLRPGAVTVEAIEKFVPVLQKEDEKDPAAVYESPGLLRSHYAPWTSLILTDKSFSDFLKELKAFQDLCHQKEIAWPRIGLLLLKGRRETQFFETVEVLSATGDLPEAASNLFQAIRKLDKMNLDLIVAERIQKSGLGLAIMDRLEKASAGQTALGPYFENLIQKHN